MKSIGNYGTKDVLYCEHCNTIQINYDNTCHNCNKESINPYQKANSISKKICCAGCAVIAAVLLISDFFEPDTTVIIVNGFIAAMSLFVLLLVRKSFSKYYLYKYDKNIAEHMDSIEKQQRSVIDEQINSVRIAIEQAKYKEAIDRIKDSSLDELLPVFEYWTARCNLYLNNVEACYETVAKRLLSESPGSVLKNYLKLLSDLHEKGYPINDVKILNKLLINIDYINELKYYQLITLLAEKDSYLPDINKKVYEYILEYIQEDRYKLKLFNLYSKSTSPDDNEKAIKLAKELFDSHEHDKESFNVLMKLLQPTDEEDFKVKLYKRYISQNPHDTAIIGQYRDLLYKIKRYPELIGIYLEELNKKPNSMKLVYEIAGIYFMDKQYENSIKKYELILSSNKYFKFIDYDQVHERLAYSLMKTGDYDKAYVHFKRALPMKEAVEGLYELALIYDKNKEANKAQHCYRLVYGNNPQFRDISERYILSDGYKDEGIT